MIGAIGAVRGGQGFVGDVRLWVDTLTVVPSELAGKVVTGAARPIPS